MIAKLVVLLLVGCAAVMAGPIDDAVGGGPNIGNIPNPGTIQSASNFQKGYDNVKSLRENGIETAQKYTQQGIPNAGDIQTGSGYQKAYDNALTNSQSGIETGQNFAKQGIETGNQASKFV